MHYSGNMRLNLKALRGCSPLPIGGSCWGDLFRRYTTSSSTRSVLHCSLLSFSASFPYSLSPTPTISKITLLSIPLPHLGEKSCRGSGHDGTCGEQHCGGSGIERVFVVICCRFVVLTRRRTHLALRPRWAIFT